MKRVLFTAVAAAAVLAGSAAAAAPAFASTAPARPVVAFTFSPDHNDTTSAAGSATTDSPNGPVWAVDQLGETFTVKPVTGLADGANYRVTVNVVGSFKGFADPRLASEGSTNPGGPLASRGLVLGTITYDVSSPPPPTPMRCRSASQPTPGSARRWASYSTALTRSWAAGRIASPTTTWPGPSTRRSADPGPSNARRPA